MPRASSIAVLGLVSCLGAIPCPAAAQATATVPAARQLMQQRKFDEAAAMLEAVVANEPENARAWLLLGFARHANRDLDAALAAHKKAATFPATAPTAMYNAGMAYALMGNKDSAFAWLRRSIETGGMNMTNIAFDTDADSLRTDPRYRALFPTEAEFADPFVERDVEILQEWRGEAQGDQFGWIARNIGDVDGDGINDVTTSAPTFSGNGPNAGKVYTYSSRTGALLWSAVGEAGYQLGLGIEAAGDVNADGIPDVVAGAPGGERVFVYSGRDGTVVLEFAGEQVGDAFGRRVSDIGDANGDGFADVLVTAPQNDAAGEDAGRAYVYSGRDGSVLVTLDGERAGDTFGSAAAGFTDHGGVWLVVGAPNAGPTNGGRTYVYRGLDPHPAFFIDADQTGSQLGGMFVSVIGDVNGDGTPDVYASDWANAASGPSTGRIYVRSGADGADILTLTGEAPGDGFGIGPADAGDVNSDGFDDLIVGAWQHNSAAPSGGKVYLYSGKDGALLRAFTGKVPGETFGFDATGMGDVNGDGKIDFLLTSAWSAVNGARSGRMYIISGS